jgi:hypothetical protein
VYYWSSIRAKLNGGKIPKKPKQERSKGMLLLTTEVQIEATTAINHMYNFKFYEAEREFNYLKIKHPNHPLPDFCWD